MAFDLLAYAREHRCRVRNLHDGRPLHPLWPGRRPKDGAKGHEGAEDRMDAIVGRHGYVCDEDDPGRIGWYLFAGSRKGMNRWLPTLVGAGAAVKRECDTEAAGDAPASSIGAILRVLSPFRYKPPHSGDIGRRVGRTGAEMYAKGLGRIRSRPKSKEAPVGGG